MYSGLGTKSIIIHRYAWWQVSTPTLSSFGTAELPFLPVVFAPNQSLPDDFDTYSSFTTDFPIHVGMIY